MLAVSGLLERKVGGPSVPKKEFINRTDGRSTWSKSEANYHSFSNCLMHRQHLFVQVAVEFQPLHCSRYTC